MKSSVKSEVAAQNMDWRLYQHGAGVLKAAGKHIGESPRMIGAILVH
jgi:hypothetical protein